MQELQCADCIMNFLETEREPQIRDYIFELLFDDIHQVSTKYILQLLLSYSISLEAQNTLECISKWIIINIGNELVQSIFNQLIRDHFVLVLNETDLKPAPNLINLARISPLFSSLFMAIVLDMLPNNLILNHEKCLSKIFNLFEIWISRDPILPVLAYRANLTHASSYLFNPLPGLLFVSVVYPIRCALECIQTHTNEAITSTLTTNKNRKHLAEKRAESCEKIAKSIEDLSSRVHFLNLKLIKDLDSHNLKSNEFKLINLKHVDSVRRAFDDLNASAVDASRPHVNGCFHSVKTLKQIREDCLDKLAQFLEVCWQLDYISCKKQEVKALFSNHDQDSLLSIILDSE